jgi:hypothetical protein
MRENRWPRIRHVVQKSLIGYMEERKESHHERQEEKGEREIKAGDSIGWEDGRTSEARTSWKGRNSVCLSRTDLDDVLPREARLVAHRPEDARPAIEVEQREGVVELDDFALFENDDSVVVGDGGESVGLEGNMKERNDGEKERDEGTEKGKGETGRRRVSDNLRR